MERTNRHMADIIIIAVLAAAVFFILRGQFRKLRRGECVGGCSGCAGCAGCASYAGGSSGGSGCASGCGQKASPGNAK